MENWLQAYDQIDAVIADSGIQQQGAYEAVSEAGRLDEVKVWTGDSLQAWIRQGRQRVDTGCHRESPAHLWCPCGRCLRRGLSGSSVPKNWFDPVSALECRGAGSVHRPGYSRFR